MSAQGEFAPNRWVILALGLAAQASTCVFLYGLPTLIPKLRAAYGLTLSGAGWVVAAPTIGLLLTLVAWGAAADRYGERNVMAIGLALAAIAIGASAATSDLLARAVLFGLGGAASGSVNAASGRVVMGWFSPAERGKAMGARQTAQPLGVGIAALALPSLADGPGLAWAVGFCALLCAAIAGAVLVWVVDPLRGAGASPPHVASGSPYRSPTLWRLHGASTLLVVPQFAVSAFSYTYLVTERHWSPSSAGTLIFTYQILGALGRIAAGWWSDHAGSRLGPMRLVAVVSAVAMGAIALGDATRSVLVVIALGLGAIITVADNGLGFTAVAELAGTEWSGRAMGVQNTAQNIASSLTPPLLGALVSAAGYDAGFGVAAVFPLLAILATPVAAEAAHIRRVKAAASQSPSSAASATCRGEPD